MSFSLFVLSVCGCIHHITIVAPLLFPAAAPTECKHHQVLRLIGDLPVTRLLNPNISGAKPPPAPRSDPSRPPCVCSVVRTRQRYQLCTGRQARCPAVLLEQHLPPSPPLPPPRHPRGPTLLQEVLLMSTTGLGSRIKTQ